MTLRTGSLSRSLGLAEVGLGSDWAEEGLCVASGLDIPVSTFLNKKDNEVNSEKELNKITKNKVLSDKEHCLYQWKDYFLAWLKSQAQKTLI